MNKIIRTSTVPGSLNSFCRGLLSELQSEGYEVVAVSSPGPELTELAGREGVRAVAVEMKRQISPLHDLLSLVRLWRVFRREKPAMVHSITPKAGLLSMIAARLAGVPLRVHTFTGLVFPTATGWRRKILMLTDRLTCACATHVIPEGEGVKDDLASFGITAKPMSVLGNGNVRGIDLNFYDPSLPEVAEAAKAIRRPDCFTFVFVGRLVADKGINELVEAFTKLHQMRPATRLILVGRLEPELDPLDPTTVSVIESSDAIEAPGEQNDVRPWLAASDALVFPSHREGFPNVVIEAGAMGLPSIVTNINGSREIILHGLNGIMIPPSDSQSLLTAMLRMTDNPERTAEMARAARDFVADRFEQAYVRHCLKEYYRQIAHEKK